MQLANSLVTMLQLSQFKAGAKTVTKQWKKKISLRQIQSRKFFAKFCEF